MFINIARMHEKRLQYNTYLVNCPLQVVFRVNETQLRKQWKRTTKTTFKNPKWPETKQLPLYKCNWEVEPGTTRNKLIEWSERVLYSGPPDLTRCLNHFFLSLWILIHTIFTAACRLFPSSPFHLFGWGLNCCRLILWGSRFYRFVIAETFMRFLPCFDSVFPVFYTFLGIISGFQSTNAMFCLECFFPTPQKNRINSTIMQFLVRCPRHNLVNVVPKFFQNLHL